MQTTVDSPATDPTPEDAPPPSRADSQGGCLWVVATPIGNRQDLSPRALQALQAATVILAEDTRSIRHLLTGVVLDKPVWSYHEHNENEAAPRLSDKIAEGARIALVSEAGTPAISDPGFRLVRECRRRGLTVIPIPGPCALTAALSVSGLPSDRFLFLGFPPPKSTARRRLLAEHRDFAGTVIFYESTHRIESLFEDMAAELGPHRCITIARELTKLHETILTGPIEQVRPRFEAGSKKGEFVVLIAKADYEL